MPKNERAGADIEKDPDILIFRGIGRDREGAVGHWWSTNPYYSLRYSEGGKGELYWTKIKQSELNSLSSDVSIEGHYQNYFFREDPPNINRATDEEITALRSNTTFSQSGPGGVKIKWPENAVEIGKKIFDR